MGKTKYLRILLPIELLFYQKFSGIEKARKVEYKLKRFKNKKIIDRIIKDQKIILGL